MATASRTAARSSNSSRAQLWHELLKAMFCCHADDIVITERLVMQSCNCRCCCGCRQLELVQVPIAATAAASGPSNPFVVLAADLASVQ